MSKKTLSLVLVLAVILVGASVVSASTNQIWQIGQPDGGVNPIEGAAEYPDTGSWVEVFDYHLDDDDSPVASPSMPGYIGPDNVCAFAGGRPCTDTAQILNITFGLECNYPSGALTLRYDRYGSEADNVEFDGDLVATVSASEGGYNSFPISLGAAAPGPHMLSIVYQGGGSGNGHYIDYMELTSSLDCQEVAIDIKPNSDPSCFNNDGNGVIPVAILGSETLDVTGIDPATVSLEGMAISAKGKSNKLLAAYEDVNYDGFTDLVIKIEDQDGVFTQGSGIARLTGSFYGGTLFYGLGDICITQ